MAKSLRDSIQKRIDQISVKQLSTNADSREGSLSESIDKMSEANIIERCELSQSQQLSAIEEEYSDKSSEEVEDENSSDCEE